MKVNSFLERKGVEELLNTFFNPSIDSETNIFELIDSLRYKDFIKDSEESMLHEIFNKVEERMQSSLRKFDNKQIDAINRVINVQPNK